MLIKLIMRFIRLELTNFFNMPESKTMKLQSGIYGFEVWREPEGWFLAKLYDVHGKEIGMTQGRTESEILDMVADCLKCSLDIPCPRYDRWFAAFKRLFNLP